MIKKHVLISATISPCLTTSTLSWSKLDPVPYGVLCLACTGRVSLYLHPVPSLPVLGRHLPLALPYAVSTASSLPLSLNTHRKVCFEELFQLISFHFPFFGSFSLYTNGKKKGALLSAALDQ